MYGEGLYRAATATRSSRRSARASSSSAREWELPGLEPAPTPETKRLGPLVDLRAHEVRPGARVPRRRCRVRDPDRRAAALQHVRPAAGALEPVHGRARDLRVAVAERPAAADLRGRAAAPRLRLRARRRARVRARAGARRRRRPRRERRQRASVTVRELARAARGDVGSELEPEITGEYRVGDIRHCFADIALAHETLGYVPRGRARGREWPSSRRGSRGRRAEDRVDDAAAELAERGLSR